MELPPTDFESAASASSAIPARVVKPILSRSLDVSHGFVVGHGGQPALP